MKHTRTLLLLLPLLLSSVFFAGCGNSTHKATPLAATDTLPEHNDISKYEGAKSAPDSILADGEIPVLCYHQIRDWKPSDTKSERVFITPVATFAAEMKMLHDNGYHYILPDQLMGYLAGKEKLPSQPILLTFDDATGPQYTNALPELEKNGFKATYFIMTVVLGHPNFMTRDEVKDLYTKGNVIGCHTWNHKNVTQYKDEDWPIQIEKPMKVLQEITGVPVKYFAYPYGAWNDNAAQHIKNYGFTAAFRLWGKYETSEPMYTIRRILVDGNWNPTQLQTAIKKDPLKNVVKPVVAK